MGQIISEPSNAMAKRSKPKIKHKNPGKAPKKERDVFWSRAFSISFINTIEAAAAGANHLSNAYNTFQTGRVERDEMRLNGDAMRSVVPDVKTCLQSLATYIDRRNVLELFQAFLSSANFIIYWVNVLQGEKAEKEIGKLIHGELEARTGLKAPRRFARQVIMTMRHQMESARPGETCLVFLYHPDTDWHGEFFDAVKQNPLPNNFLGMSENLDALVTWMLFVRQRLPKKLVRARFHLVIPAYRPMLVKEPLIFPEALYPLTITGLVHNSKPLVWFDLPTVRDDVNPQLLELHHIGNLSCPPSQWQRPVAATAGVVTGGAGIAVAAVATVAAASFIGPLAGVIWLGGGGAAIAGGDAVSDQVARMFDSPAPRVLGWGAERAGVDREADEMNNFNIEPGTRRVSRNSRHIGRGNGDRRRRAS
ncbi:hypothetical protein OQA88_11583 [Cercophora sp. LCS_1]